MRTARGCPPPAHRRWLVAAILYALLSGVPTAMAQQRAGPFETVDLTLELLTDVHQGTLQRDWSPGPAVGLGAALPFYLGTVELGAQLAYPSARRTGLPDFRSLFVYAGWSGTRDLGRRLRAEAGVRAGLVALRFVVDTIAEFRRHESEPAVAARGAVRWTPRDPWFAEAAVAWQSTFTEPRIEQVFIAAGLGRRFRTPTWLQDFLD